jgi:hypothetical protein
MNSGSFEALQLHLSYFTPLNQNILTTLFPTLILTPMHKRTNTGKTSLQYFNLGF